MRAIPGLPPVECSGQPMLLLVHGRSRTVPGLW
jgi:hypothetical protein